MTLKTGDFLRCSEELLPNWIEVNFIWAEGKMSSVALRNNCSTRELRTAKKNTELWPKRDSDCGNRHLLGDVSKVNSLLLCFTLLLGEGMIYWVGLQGCTCAFASTHCSGWSSDPGSPHFYHNPYSEFLCAELKTFLRNLIWAPQEISSISNKYALPSVLKIFTPTKHLSHHILWFIISFWFYSS